MLQLHFIAVADWQTPLPSPWLQKNNKTTKHNGLITVFIVKPPNQLQMTRCVGADRVYNCCHMFVRVKQCFRSKLQAVWFWRTGFITWRGCAPLFSTVTRLFSDVLLECSHLLKWPAQWCCLISSFKGRRAAQNHETYSRMCLWWENVCELVVTAVSRCYDGRN